MRNFLNTMQVVKGLESALEAMTFPEEILPETTTTLHAGDRIWQVVSKQSTPSLALAIEKAIAVTERLACVVPGRERYEPVQGGVAAAQKRIQTFIILMSGVDFDPFEATSFYGDHETPGLLAIKDHVIEKLYGETLGVKGAIVIPRAGESVRFADDQDGQADIGISDIREGYALTVDVTMGVMQACTSRGVPIRRI